MLVLNHKHHVVTNIIEHTQLHTCTPKIWPSSYGREMAQFGDCVTNVPPFYRHRVIVCCDNGLIQGNDFVTSLIFEFLWFVEQANSFQNHFKTFSVDSRTFHVLNNCILRKLYFERKKFHFCELSRNFFESKNSPR